MNAPARSTARNIAQVVSPTEETHHGLHEASINGRQHADPALLRGAANPAVQHDQTPVHRNVMQVIRNFLEEGLRLLNAAAGSGPVLVAHELPAEDARLFHPMRNARGDRIHSHNLTGTLQGQQVDFRSVLPAGTRLELKGITPQGIVVGNTYREGNAAERRPILFCLGLNGKLVKSSETSYFAGNIDADYGSDKQLEYKIARYIGIDQRGRIVAETSTNVPPEHTTPTRQLLLKAESPYL